ncbi:hypothetical protein [Xylanibacter ruminicola]|nr:hypothetical protein [Xylanibacter ruminicola]
MNTKYIKILSVVFMAVAAVGVSSCTLDSTEEAVTGKQQGSDIVLNIRTTSVSNQTRSATVISNGYDSNNKTSVTSAEMMMTNLTVGLFKSTGSTLDIKEVDIEGTGEEISSQKTISSTYSSGLPDAQKPANGDLVRVAINLPPSKVATIKGKAEEVWNVASATNFKATALTIDQALDMDNDGDVNPAELPMVGNSTIAFNSIADKWESTVTVHHLVSKVTLASLSVDFSTTKHTAASFTPTEIFLVGVPDKINLDMNDGTYAFSQGAYAGYYQGESTNATNQKDYLGTGTGIADVTMNASHTSYGTAYTLYTLPNNNDAGNLTFLVIKGTYSSDGQAWNSKTVYYPVFIGAKTTNVVQPNAHYVVNATIKGDGASSIADLASVTTATLSNAVPSTIQDLDVQVTVTDFDDESVTATFTNSGIISYQGLPDPVPGDLLFADGTWGTLDMFPDKTPVAIVFSTNVSAVDYAAGFQRGYAIALKDVSSSATMAWSTESIQLGTPVDITNQTKLDDYVASAGYMDGRSETNLITSTANYSQAVYPAAYAAVTTYESEVAHPAGTSGWYLPSIGQQYEWIKFFGGISTNPGTFHADNYCYWSGAASSTASAFNTAAKNCLKNTGATVDKSNMWTDIAGSGGYYWASTESAKGAGYAFSLNFDTDGSLYLAGNGTRSGTDLRVRPVLAF